MNLTQARQLLDTYGPDKILVAYRPKGHRHDVEVGLLRSIGGLVIARPGAVSGRGVFVLYHGDSIAKLTDPVDLTAFDPTLRYDPEQCPMCGASIRGFLFVEPEEKFIHPLAYRPSANDVVTLVQVSQLTLVPCLHPIDQLTETPDFRDS